MATFNPSGKRIEKKKEIKKGVRIVALQMIGDGGILVSYVVYQAQTLSCTWKKYVSLCILAILLQDTYEGVPRSGTQTDAIVADTKAANTVLVTAEGADFVSPQNIPNLSHG